MVMRRGVVDVTEKAVAQGRLIAAVHLTSRGAKVRRAVSQAGKHKRTAAVSLTDSRQAAEGGGGYLVLQRDAALLLR